MYLSKVGMALIHKHKNRNIENVYTERNLYHNHLEELNLDFKFRVVLYAFLESPTKFWI